MVTAHLPLHRTPKQHHRKVTARRRRYSWRAEKSVPLVALLFVVMGLLTTGPIWLWLLGGIF